MNKSVLILAIVFSVTTVRAGGDACRTTTKAAAKACAGDAKADYALALGKCANLADPAAQQDCKALAKAKLQEALADCRDQADARAAACDRLGPDPYDPVINPVNFGGPITNRFLPLIPGTTFVYVGGTESNVVEVTHNTVVILGVTCVEVHDRVFDNGELIEDTLDWFAQDNAGNVWYFGENTHELEDGLIISLHGQWTAGVDGAKPGIVMKANPQVGDFYRQEFALGTAEDLAEVTGLNEVVDVAAGHFVDCRKVRETTPLEPDLMEDKYYAPGIGLVLEVDAETGARVELVQVIGP
jgi:hypothetical protein